MTAPTRIDPDWEEQMAMTFGHLLPGTASMDDARVSGTVTSVPLGRVTAFDVSGNSQTLRRTASSIRRAPGDLLKVCVQRSGVATLRQGESEVRLRPGQMALYDTGRPYDLHLEGRWRCAVMTLPREALSVPWRRVADSMTRVVPTSSGPGSVLAHLLGSSPTHCGGHHLGEAGIHLLTEALEIKLPAETDSDAVREAVRAWVRAHAGDPDLTHGAVARAHHMSSRTLYRLFTDKGSSVTELIRETRLAGVRADLSNPAHAERPIMAVASRWGFRDQAHLTRVFGATFGVTPGAFRRSSLGSRPVDTP